MEELVVLDCEVYKNYMLIAFKNISNNKIVTLYAKGEDSCLNNKDILHLNIIMKKRITFGFNSLNYDIPIILYILKEKTCKEVYKLSQYIIENRSPAWKTIKIFNLYNRNKWNHFDLEPVSPGVKVSLKLYGARMHSKKIQDLPYSFDSELSDDEMENIRTYCINDLNTTIDLYEKIKERINLRIDIGRTYNMDFRSKSDAQIAETIIKYELEKLINKKINFKPFNNNIRFKYKKPNFISFKDIKINNALKIIENHNFELDSRGYTKLPKDIKNLKIQLGKSTYQLGIGGIHSMEKAQTITPLNNQMLIDKDVTAYYPNLILNLNLYPRHLGKYFLNIYKNIVNERIKAKKEKNKLLDSSLKIVINGTFGKLGSKYSVLYSPDLMLTVTLTGQLSLLMLIETLELNKINVISANTDGFVSLFNKEKYDLYNKICSDWQLKTGFNLEETRYDALYSRDVNNYLAIINKNSKGKGLFAEDSITKNPQAIIIIDAIKNFLINKEPIANTIKKCKDITKFLHVRSVTGGAVYKNKYLGRVVRWIYSTKGETIRYYKNGNKVAKSDLSRPIMELNDFPNDIDYDRYINESNTILEDIGLYNI